MCTLAAQELRELAVERYTRFNFSGADVSLKTAEPHLTAGAPTVEAVLGAVHRALIDLSTQLQQQTPQLKGLTAEALVPKGAKYQKLTALFRNYHGYVTNAQAYLADLQHAVEIFTRPLICTTDTQTFRLYDTEFEAQAKTLQAAAFGKIQELGSTKDRFGKTMALVLKAETDANYHLGLFGKTVTAGGELGFIEATKQWTKPRDHRV